MRLCELTEYLDNLLKLQEWPHDHSNNGLQIEGKAEVLSVVGGVDASLSLFEAAAERKADFVLVHHGISWGSEPRRFTGITARRLKTMFTHDMSLYAAHLPLDAHAEVGNNAELCRIAGITDLKPFCEYDGGHIGFTGMLPAAMSAGELAGIYEKALNTKAMIFNSPEKSVKKVAAVSGGGGMEALGSAIEAKADVLVTGEFNQIMYYPALENGMTVIALGHYASETVGVKAVLAKLSAMGLKCEFIDLPTGV